MLRLIAFLVTGCWHKWKILRRANVFERGFDLPVNVDYELQCEKCGTVKGKRL